MGKLQVNLASKSKTESKFHNPQTECLINRKGLYN